MNTGARGLTLGAGRPKANLWKPGTGIRFAPESETPPLYPMLDFKRFFQSQEATTATSCDGPPSAPSTPQPLQASATPDKAPPKRCQEKQPISSVITATRVIEVASKTALATYTVRKQPTSHPTGCSSAKECRSTVEPPVTSLDFNISKELFQAALDQPKDSPGSFWSHAMYKSTAADGTTQNVKVHYCTSKHTMEHICQTYFLNEPVLGFDLEWVAYARRGGGPRENVSLIQIASPSRIGLFHVALFPKDDFVAPTFRAIMEDAAVEKVGVHIQADCTRLRNFLGVKTRGIVELSHLYKLVKHARDEQRRKLINKVPVALSTQVQEVLKLPLFKGQSVRGSNWSKPLTSKQLTYSAADAYAGLQLFHVLEERRRAMDPTPDRPRHAELGLPIPIPPTPVVSDAESDVDSDLESVEGSIGSDFSDGSIEEAMLELAVAATSASTAQSCARTANDQTAARDVRVEAAEARVAQRRSTRPGGRLLATPSSLRAFYIWQTNDDLTPADVAGLLRDPPLQTGTVITYILDAILAERLEYPKARLRREVLSLLHPTLAGGKYRAVVNQCSQAGT
ncbi:hypothetical protein V2A60_003606 [Cordyceps javanica]